MAQPTTDPGADVEVDEHKVQRGAIWLTRALTYLVYAYLLVVTVILVLGFFLKLFGANPDSSFVRWAYRNLDAAMRPFRGIFAPIELGTTGNDVQATLETSIIFALLIYGLLAIAVSALISWLTQRIHRLDNASIRERARLQHERELQALRDRAMVIEAEREARAAGRYPAGSAASDTRTRLTNPAPIDPAGGQAPPPR